MEVKSLWWIATNLQTSLPSWTWGQCVLWRWKKYFYNFPSLAITSFSNTFKLTHAYEDLISVINRPMTEEKISIQQINFILSSSISTFIISDFHCGRTAYYKWKKRTFLGWIYLTSLWQCCRRSSRPITVRLYMRLYYAVLHVLLRHFRLIWFSVFLFHWSSVTNRN